jgi:3-hydroxyisobutyrate dehydrogenase-like beta-hydroxyacid dehydrogenase
MMGSNVTTVSVVGLGTCGLTIANLLHEYGFAVTALDPFRDTPRASGLTFRWVRNLEQAIDASEIVITCVETHSVMDARLCSPEATYALHGKALLSLNIAATRSAATARTIVAWARSANIDFLEADLFSGVQDVGSPVCQVVCSGPDRSRDRLHEVLSVLSPNYVDLGHDRGYARLREAQPESQTAI